MCTPTNRMPGSVRMAVVVALGLVVQHAQSQYTRGNGIEWHLGIKGDSCTKTCVKQGCVSLHTGIANGSSLPFSLCHTRAHNYNQLPPINSRAHTNTLNPALSLFPLSCTLPRAHIRKHTHTHTHTHTNTHTSYGRATPASFACSPMFCRGACNLGEMTRMSSARGSTPTFVVLCC